MDHLGLKLQTHQQQHKKVRLLVYKLLQYLLEVLLPQEQQTLLNMMELTGHQFQQ